MANYLGLKKYRNVSYEICIKESGESTVLHEHRNYRNILTARRIADELTEFTGIKHFVNTVNKGEKAKQY